jgi:hypothetical protein
MDTQAKEELVRLTREYGGEWGINHTQRLLRLGYHHRIYQRPDNMTT